MTAINFKQLPKVELHLHLDTSMRIETIRKYLIREKLAVPEPLSDACVAPFKCKNLVDYLSRITPALNALQSTDAIEETAYQMVEMFAENHHIYTEVRFAPHLHTEKGETPQSVLEAAFRGFKRGTKDFGVDIGIILCALRHFSPEQNETVVKLALNNEDRICGFDLASDESISGLKQKPLFDRIHDAGIPITVHAGEACGPERMAEAIDYLHAVRIGHGVRLKEDKALLARIIDLQIVLEMCPTSNVQTDATESYESHPINDYLNLGVCVTVNTDSYTITPSNLTKEYDVLNKTFGWGIEQFTKTQRNAIEHSFLSADKKKILLDRFEQEMKRVVG